MYRDNLDDFDKIMTLDELRLELEDEYKNMRRMKNIADCATMTQLFCNIAVVLCFIIN